MKKIFAFIALAVIVLISTSCEGPAGRDGRDGRDGLVNFKIIDLEVRKYQWQYSNLQNNNYFVAEFDMPEITKYIYDNGMVQVYREYNTDTSDAIQLLLPSTRHIEYDYEVEDDDNLHWGFYTETIDYEYGVGLLNVYFTASDFAYELDDTIYPEDMHFIVRIMW